MARAPEPIPVPRARLEELVDFLDRVRGLDHVAVSTEAVVARLHPFRDVLKLAGHLRDRFGEVLR